MSRAVSHLATGNHDLIEVNLHRLDRLVKLLRSYVDTMGNESLHLGDYRVQVALVCLLPLVRRIQSKSCIKHLDL